MALLDTIIVLLAVGIALFYLARVLRPRKKKGPSCGCGSVDCKVPKPKLDR